jgi:hypothetical protein
MARTLCKEERAYIIQQITDLQAACLRLQSLGYVDPARTNLCRLNMHRLDLDLPKVKTAEQALEGVKP